MAEIVPNRVPCGKKPTPTPPQPEPTPVTLCDITGIKYFKLQSQIPGDYTKNCGLLGNEIDENFYFLRSMDIKTGYTVVEDDRKYLVLERVNCGREIKIDITDEDAYDHGFRVDNGYIYVKYPDGHEDPIRDGEGKAVRFLVEGENVRVITDASITGDGTYENPLSVDLVYRTGTYMPADFYADITCPEETIKQFENIGNGHAIVTKEKTSRFGRLYTWGEAMALNKVLNETYGELGWRVPSKEDWAALLNWAESNPADRDHDTDKSGNFGCNAGARLKTTTLWENRERNTDDFGFSIYPVGICPEAYNTKEAPQYGFTGLYKVASYWTSSEKDGEGYVRTFSYGHDDVAQYTESPARRLSIRLVRNIGEDFDVKEYEEILGNYVPVVLTTDGKQLWTQFNIDFTDNDYEGIVPEAWSDIETTATVKTFYELVDDEYVEVDEYDLPSYAEPVFVDEVPTEVYTDSDPLAGYIFTESTLHLDMTTESKFYFNVWDGNRWHKKMMREGESVVIVGEDFETGCDTAATPYVTSANTNHEWRVYFNEETGLDELIDVAEAIKDEMNKEFKEIHELISGLTERVEILSGFVGDIYDEMQSGFTSAFTAIDDLQRQIDEEASARTEGDELLEQLIEEEASARTIADEHLQEQIDALSEAISAETAERIAADEELWEALSAETVERIAADEELQSEIEELKKKTIEPLDDSIIVETSGYTTSIGVKLPENGMIKVDEYGLYFDGNFGTDEEDEE